MSSFLTDRTQVVVFGGVKSEVVYKKSIGTKMNDLDLCLEIVQGHVNHNVTFANKYLGVR